MFPAADPTPALLQSRGNKYLYLYLYIIIYLIHNLFHFIIPPYTLYYVFENKMPQQKIKWWLRVVKTFAIYKRDI